MIVTAGTGREQTRVIPAPLPGSDDEQFWTYLNVGEVRIQRCQGCREWRYPPSPTCSRCLSEETEWAVVGGGGSLLAWATFHRRYFAELDPPYLVAAVALDEGPIMCGDLRGELPDRLKLGMRVELAAEPAVLQDGQSAAIFSWYVSEGEEQ